MNIKKLPHHSKLGRHVQHDPRSFKFAVGALPKSAIESRDWTRRVPIFDQGNLGSCVGNAAAGWVGTDNALREGVALLASEASVDEEYAIELYEQATVLDDFPGTYKPDDTGSSGLGGAKALQQGGLCGAYEHAFSLEAAYAALQVGPILIGIPWYNSMFTPQTDGRIPVEPASGLVGGHEILGTGIEIGTEGVAKVWIDNSWGASWGLKGRGYFTPSDLATLLADEGDVISPAALLSAPPAPNENLVLTITDQTIRDTLIRRAQRKNISPDDWLEHRLFVYFL